MPVNTTEINEILSKLSSFGKYQKRNFLLISLAIIFSAVQYSYVFSTRSTKHRCFIEECDNDTVTAPYNQSWLANAIPIDGITLRKCERYGPNINLDSNLETDETCSARMFNTSDVEICDRLVVDGNFRTTIEHEFNLTCEDNLWKLTALGSLDEIAEVIFSPFVGYFSDRFGRKWVLINSLVLSGICGVIKSFSPSYVFFAIMEFVTACFTSGIYGSGFILGVELLVAEQRVFGSTIIAIVFPFGEILIGLAAWFSPSWRFMLQVLYAPGVLFFCYFWLLDDSLCFLLANGKMKKARQVIKRITRTNNLNIPEEIQLKLENTTNKPATASKASTSEDSNSHSASPTPSKEEGEVETEQHESFFQLFHFPSLIFRVLNCSFSWISCTFMYYGLTIYSVSLTGNIYLNFIIMAVIELPGYVICYYTLDYFGRRFTLVASLLLSGLACLAVSLIPTDIWMLQIALPIIGKFAATMAFKTIYIYTAEMFPTTLRHTSLAFCSMFGRAGSIAAPQLPILATISPLLPAVVFGILGISAGILAFFLPETTGCKLPDTLEESLVFKKKEDIEMDKISK